MGCRGWHLAGREIARLYFSRGHMGSVWLLLCAHGDGLCALWIWGRECLGVSFCPHIVSSGVRYRVHAVTTSVAGGCVKPSVGSSSAPPGTKTLTNKNGPLSTFVSECDRGHRVDRLRHRALCSRWDVDAWSRGNCFWSCFWPAVGGSRPARATASAAGRKRSTKRFYYAYPTTDEPCTIMNVRRRDMRGTGAPGRSDLDRILLETRRHVGDGRCHAHGRRRRSDPVLPLCS